MGGQHVNNVEIRKASLILESQSLGLLYCEEPRRGGCRVSSPMEILKTNLDAFFLVKCNFWKQVQGPTVCAVVVLAEKVVSAVREARKSRMECDIRVRSFFYLKLSCYSLFYYIS